MTDRSIAFVRTEEAPQLPPPPGQSGIGSWLWRNMFASMSNFSTPGAAVQSLLMILATVVVGYFGVTQLIGLVKFGLLDAVWSAPEGVKREACSTVAQGGPQPEGWYGACYPYVAAKWQFFMYGFYPTEELWRVNIVYLLGSIGVAWLTMSAVPARRGVGFALIASGVALAAYVSAIATDGFDAAGFLMSAPVGAHILVGVGVVLAVAPDTAAARKIVGVIMLTLYPLLCFILLTGGGEPLDPVNMGAVILVALGAYGLGWAGDRGMLGEIGQAFGGTLSGLGVLIGICLVVVSVASIDYGLEVVETDQWGGLLVTMVVAIAGIVFSLPLGVLLALGRRSSLPAVRILSIVFIEFWRGVPLITVLFMSSVMLPLFLPEGVEFNKLLRALIGVMLFSAAYQAEVVRGGLQAIPKGQYEGAQALGVSYWAMMRLIILPQALVLVIPGIVNTFIGLFKDTTLVLIISIFDLLGSIQSALTDASWATPVQASTGYFLAAVIYFVFCFGMSRYSLYLEQTLRRGHAR